MKTHTLAIAGCGKLAHIGMERGKHAAKYRIAYCVLEKMKVTLAFHVTYGFVEHNRHKGKHPT